MTLNAGVISYFVNYANACPNQNAFVTSIPVLSIPCYIMQWHIRNNKNNHIDSFRTHGAKQIQNCRVEGDRPTVRGPELDKFMACWSCRHCCYYRVTSTYKSFRWHKVLREARSGKFDIFLCRNPTRLAAVE